ncbi:MAG TPA: filamentous hemagglutinin N-terminal domain-containing protein [Nevskia sp.]|nr:filamentous hemagglutinin N-terminal domain-containing protein [Nevskia sp.]
MNQNRRQSASHTRPAQASAVFHPAAAPIEGSLPQLRRRSFPFAAYFLSAALTTGAVLLSPDAEAGPTGGVVVGGSGTIGSSGTTTTINQSSQRLSLNWQTFNVNANETVNFVQPSSSSVALNRILDQNASQIFGSINANGQIFLINKRGIIFGESARLNVGGLLASSLDLTSNNFLAGNYSLDANGQLGAIVNHGLIVAASGGSVSLIGSKVVNDGLILANYGRINLGAADRAFLDFDGDGLITVEVTGELRERLDAAAPAISNTGELRSEGGTVVLQASATRELFNNLINNSGVISAGSISSEGGVVRLVANGGNVQNSGRIDATGTRGGSIQLLSDRDVLVTGQAVVDASGRDAGGSVRIGGGISGGEGLLQAERSYVADGATVSADATGNGNGGSVVVYSKTNTVIAGDLSAQGGTQGGNGGFVETSSQGGFYISKTPKVGARTVDGLGGEWLIDPYDITIVADGAGNNTFDPADPFAANAEGTTIDVGLLITALNGGNTVTVTTGGALSPGGDPGDITLATSFDYDGIGSGTLNLNAARDIVIDGVISDGVAGGDLLNVNFQAGRAIAINQNIQLNGGDAVLNATTGNITRSNSAVIDADDITATAATGVQLAINANTLSVINNGETGNIDLTEQNGVTVALLQQTNAANVAGTVSLVSDTGSIALTDGSVLSQGGLITLTATTGAITDAGGGGVANIRALNDGDAVLTAATGIGSGDAIETSIDALTASVTGIGSLEIDEADALTITSATTSNGAITIVAGGALTATSVVSTTDSDANDISLTATTGDLSVGTVNAGAAGDVTLTATAGAITDANGGTTNVTADVLTATAATGIDLDTAIASLDASVTGAGNLTIDEADAITLVDVDTANGAIAITAAGAVTATDVAATGGSASLTSTGAAAAFRWQRRSAAPVSRWWRTPSTSRAPSMPAPGRRKSARRPMAPPSRWAPSSRAS